MFERNKIDNAPEQSTVPVEIALSDGAMVKGKLLVAAGKTLIDVLNGSGAFIEFEPYGGERQYLAKSRIDSLKPVGVPSGGVPPAACPARRLRPLSDPRSWSRHGLGDHPAGLPSALQGLSPRPLRQCAAAGGSEGLSGRHGAADQCRLRRVGSAAPGCKTGREPGEHTHLHLAAQSLSAARSAVRMRPAPWRRVRRAAGRCLPAARHRPSPGAASAAPAAISPAGSSPAS